MTTIPPPEPPKIEDIENYHPNGKLKEKGILVNGKKDGFWTSWYENGQKSEEQTYKYWDLRINSTLPIYTSEYSIRVNSGDFNSTMNSTALGNSSGSNLLPMANLNAMLTGSGWSPYFNQIQLFENQIDEKVLFSQFLANVYEETDNLINEILKETKK